MMSYWWWLFLARSTTAHHRAAAALPSKTTCVATPPSRMAFCSTAWTTAAATSSLAAQRRRSVWTTVAALKRQSSPLVTATSWLIAPGSSAAAHVANPRNFGTKLYLQVDDQGRRIRQRRPDSGKSDDNKNENHGNFKNHGRTSASSAQRDDETDATFERRQLSRDTRPQQQPQQQPQGNNGGWEDFDPLKEVDGAGSSQSKQAIRTSGERYNHNSNNAENNRYRGGASSSSSGDNDQAESRSWVNDAKPSQPQQHQRGGGGWDDSDPSEQGNDDSYERKKTNRPYSERDRRPSRFGDSNSRPFAERERRTPSRFGGDSNTRRGMKGNDRFRSSSFGDGDGDNNARGRGRRSESSGSDNYASSSSAMLLPKINMKDLEGAGFVHLYGLASCANALRANRREFVLDDTREKELQTPQWDEQGGLASTPMQPEDRSKPEAQFRPWLFVQEQSSSSPSSSRSQQRSSDKVTMADEIERLAQERGVPVTKVDRGVLNAFSGNRPHQGYVLRCGMLSFEPLPRIPFPPESSLWLVLDEVVDPQNLGALIRTAYFLGLRDQIMVCAKNSAPPSAVVSAASAGALESATIFSTANLPRTLQQARADGFRIIGASSSVPLSVLRHHYQQQQQQQQQLWQQQQQGEGDEDEGESKGGDDVKKCYDLNELPLADGPTILVLGSEGHGLRTLVARACSEFVRIPSSPGSNGEGDDEAATAAVDSLNVSVTGGILLWHLLRR